MDAAQRARLRALAEANGNLGALIRGVTRSQVLALLDALDSAERERDDARAERDQTALEFDVAWGAALKANTERDALAADAWRYRVLCETHPGVLCFMGRDCHDKAEFDAAIDEYIALDGAKGSG